jgi:hypothetical protein
MPLLGTTFDNQYCYVLFPYLPHSLRTEVNRRPFPNNNNNNNNTTQMSPSTTIPPWSELVVLELFAHGRIRIVDCSPLRVLAKVPNPPKNTPPPEMVQAGNSTTDRMEATKGSTSTTHSGASASKRGDLRIPKPPPPHHDVEDPTKIRSF